MFSLCRFQDAITFKSVDDAAIDYVQQFISTKLKNLLDKKQPNESQTINRSDFFGEIYVENPEEFEFQLGDIYQIKAIQNHVANLISTEKGLRHFEPINSGAMKNWSSYSGTVFYKDFGRFFTTNDNRNCDKSDNKNTAQISSLYENIKKLLNDRGVESDKVNLFKENMAVVKLNPISGSVSCVLCKEGTDQFVVGTTMKGDKTYWLNSNYGKHLARAHGYAPIQKRAGKTKNMNDTKRLKNEMVEKCCSNDDQPIKAKIHNKDNHILELEMELYKNIMNLLEQKCIHLKQDQQFVASMFGAEYIGDKVCGFVDCVLCDASDRKRFKITCESSDGGFRWLNTDYANHIDEDHIAEQNTITSGISKISIEFFFSNYSKISIFRNQYQLHRIGCSNT